MKTCCVLRWGGFGDMLQASSILPELKKQGYKVIFETTPKGQNAILHDPNIDEWIIDEEGSIPPDKVGKHIMEQAEKFDRFINLCEATECNAIAYPGRISYLWPTSTRQAYYGNLNYMDLVHTISEVKSKPNIVFYPTEEEREWALQTKVPSKPVILWTLAGSSYHKVYPYVDNVIAALMLNTDAVVYLCGDVSCKILEQGWENEERVIRTSGEWSIRQTLTFAQVSDIVVGPETGVLNCVGFDKKVHKVLMLSHSNEYNLCKGWRNFVALKPKKCPCFPCHRIHKCVDYCTTDEETGAALCCSNIHPKEVFEAIKRKL